MSLFDKPLSVMDDLPSEMRRCVEMLTADTSPEETTEILARMRTCCQLLIAESCERINEERPECGE